MREIKFRAWDKVNKKMQYSGIVWGEYDFPVLSGFNYGDDINNLSNLMQYTGLKDKNGKEIYEGDIIQWINYTTNDGMKNITVIEYDDKDASFYIGNWYDRYFPDTSKEALIIGNIYENPALLDWCIQI